MKQISKRTQILRNKKTYKIGATTSLTLLLAACGNSSVFLATSNADTFVGEPGNNTVSYASSPDVSPINPNGVNIDLFNGTNTGGFADGDTLTDIQNIIGSAFDDEIRGNDEDNVLDGGDGENLIYGGGGNDTITTGGHQNTLRGGGGNDTITGGDNQNTIYGDAGADILTGGAGQDTIYGGSGNDTLNGGGDNDELRGDDGDDTLNGGVGDDYIRGGNGNDILNGGAGSDTINGGGHNDTINGGAGNDFIRGHSGVDTVEIDFAINIATNIEINLGGNTINIVNGAETDSLSSIEFIKFGAITIDVQDIWNDLAQAERDKFVNEAAFDTWLGADAGYNYEGI